MPGCAKLKVTPNHRVSFSHDSDSLMKPHPTMRVYFDITLEPSALMTSSHCEVVEPPQKRPPRKLFGSLSEMVASLNDPECRDCDCCDRTYDTEHNWHHNPSTPEKEWQCETCYNDELLADMMEDLSITENTRECEFCHARSKKDHYAVEYNFDDASFDELNTPEIVCESCFTENVITCPNCYNKTSVQSLQTEGCEHCGLGVASSETGLGIACEFCDRSYSDECDWENGNRVLAEYDIPHDWLSVCPECQTDDDLLKRLDEEAEEYALYYFKKKHPKKFNLVLDQVLNCMGMPPASLKTKKTKNQKNINPMMCGPFLTEEEMWDDI